MAYPTDDVRAVPEDVLLVYCLRFMVACVILLSTMNYNTILEYTIQVHFRALGGCPAAQRQHVGARGGRGANKAEDSDQPSSRRRTNNPSHRSPSRQRFSADDANGSESSKHSSNTSRHAQPSPPPYSFDPPAPHAKHGFESMLALYEDIMASDSATIMVQQETLRSQQEIVRSQAHMIRTLRHILEEQDAQIQELETMNLAPTNKS